MPLMRKRPQTINMKSFHTGTTQTKSSKVHRSVVARNLKSLRWSQKNSGTAGSKERSSQEIASIRSSVKAAKKSARKVPATAHLKPKLKSNRAEYKKYLNAH